MDVGTLEQWLWDAACEIRGRLDAPKFKGYDRDVLVFETDGPAWIVEIKGDNLAEQEDTKEKAEAPRVWANAVSAETGQEWKYRFITQSQVVQAKGSWDAMKAMGA